MFIDTAKIFIRSGKGGDGSISFRREKYVPFGGPDGGDGGDGGSVILTVDSGMTTLLDFKYKKKYAAGNGENGSSSRSYGKDGKDLYIKVPKGTVVKDVNTDKIIADLSHDGDSIIVASNTHITLPTIQSVYLSVLSKSSTK